MRALALCSLLVLTGCATLTADAEQTITVVTEPAGAQCSLSNSVGQWEIAKTPGSADVTRSYSPLAIHCALDTQKGSSSVEPQTRGRAYGNLLLLGIPAAVDAGTGKGYEYETDTVTIPLK